RQQNCAPSPFVVRQWPPAKPLGESFRFDVLERKILTTLSLADFEISQDVRMLNTDQSGGFPRLASFLPHVNLQHNDFPKLGRTRFIHYTAISGQHSDYLVA